MTQRYGDIDEVSNSIAGRCHPPLLARALGSIGASALITDANGCIVWVNDAFTRLSGYSASEILGASTEVLEARREARPSYRALWLSASARGETWQGELTNRRKDGAVYVTDEIVTPLFDDQGAVSHFIALQNDVTQIKKIRQHERYLANHDAATGLASRAHLLSLLSGAVGEAQRAGQAMAVLFVDLDRFKPINDAYGHHIGDAVLKAVAERLLGVVRRSDTVARFGGDEFVVLLPSIANRRVALRLAAKILALLAEPFALGATQHMLGASIGIAFYPDHGASAEALLIHADQAMYRAKRMGGQRYRVVNTEDRTGPSSRAREAAGPALASAQG